MSMKNKARFDLGSGRMPFIPRQQQKTKNDHAVERLFKANSLLTQALALHQAGKLIKAEQLYRKILQIQPDNYDCLHLLGIIHYQRGEHSEAICLFDKVLKHNPKFSSAHNNRGNALKEMSRFDEALASYDQAIALQSADADVFNNRGVVLYELKRFAEALVSCDRAFAIKPDHAKALNTRANILKELKRYDEALASCDKAVSLMPDYVDAFNTRGVVLYEMRRFDEALTSYDQALAIKSDDAEVIKNRANLLARLKRFSEAVTAYNKATKHGPNQRYLDGLRLYAKMSICDWDGFEADCSHLKSAIASGNPASQPFTLLAVAAEPALQRKCAELYIADKCSPAPAPLWRGERYAHQRIRIAYVSADLREHPVAVLTAGLFECHDRSRFETIAVATGFDAQDRMSKRLKASFDQFYDAQTMSDREAAELIRDLEVDIAVDLNGFTEGSRLNIFASRPAPIQVNYLGYAGTMGRNYWDYIIADRFVIPEKQKGDYSEEIVYLPDSFMPSDSGRKISDRTPSRIDAGLPENGFVFCCFNNSYKITPDAFDIWMRLLRGVDGSVLWLSASSSTAMQNLRNEATKRGISSDRLIFAPRVESNEDHLARHRLADLFLDTFCYNAHATANDALWASVPILTCSGSAFANRVAGSLLNSIGLPEMITHSLEEYEALALKLARQPDFLAAIKQKLARQRETYPLFNTRRFTRHIEAAHQTMWERYQRGEPPQSFAVDPIA